MGKLNRTAFLSLLLVIVMAISAVTFVRRAYVVPVLMYHSIGNEAKIVKLFVSPESFEKQMKFLYKNHYNVVGLEKIIFYIEKKEKVPPKTVAITFDDGYYNNYQYAYPILKMYKLPATLFVIVDKIGQPGWLNWRELREMSDSGIFTIGSHTRAHYWLPALGTKKLEHELVSSKKILEERLGKRVDLFCYPLGAFDQRVRDAVIRAGYRSAVATNPGRSYPSNDRYVIKRVRISNTSDNLFVFWIESSGLYTWVKEHRDS
jgi:peptidoglycan/xylan/chitin deacetylase (PgdA/CDA1 family)